MAWRCAIDPECRLRRYFHNGREIIMSESYYVTPTLLTKVFLDNIVRHQSGRNRFAAAKIYSNGYRCRKIISKGCCVETKI